jgi:predicted nucleotidyltransferase
MIHDRKINFNRIGERIERLKEIPQRIEGIELIVLFGSLAEGEPKPLSDIDVAFQVANLDSKKRTQIWGETTDALETDEVDIVYLNDEIPYRLRFEIAQTGQLLYESSEGKFMDFRVLATVLWMDFKPLANYQSQIFWERLRKGQFAK